MAGEAEGVAAVVEELVQRLPLARAASPFSCSIRYDPSRATASTAQLHQGMAIGAVPAGRGWCRSWRNLLSMVSWVSCATGLLALGSSLHPPSQSCPRRGPSGSWVSLLHHSGEHRAGFAPASRHCGADRSSTRGADQRPLTLPTRAASARCDRHAACSVPASSSPARTRASARPPWPPGCWPRCAAPDTVSPAAKVGPDFIDPGYHALAGIRPAAAQPRRLDCAVPTRSSPWRRGPARMPTCWWSRG